MEALRATIPCLNPLFIGSWFSADVRWDVRTIAVLIPFLSGRGFLHPVCAGWRYQRRLNPLFIGSWFSAEVLRAGGVQPCSLNPLFIGSWFSAAKMLSWAVDHES